MPWKTLIHKTQIASHLNRDTQRRIKSRLVKMANGGAIELVPSTGSGLGESAIFRDPATNIYLLYSQTPRFEEGMKERVVAAVPKARQKVVDLDAYSKRMRKGYFPDC
jgi:hypothetical protein